MQTGFESQRKTTGRSQTEARFSDSGKVPSLPDRRLEPPLPWFTPVLPALQLGRESTAVGAMCLFGPTCSHAKSEHLPNLSTRLNVSKKWSRRAETAFCRRMSLTGPPDM